MKKIVCLFITFQHQYNVTNNKIKLNYNKTINIYYETRVIINPFHPKISTYGRSCIRTQYAFKLS